MTTTTTRKAICFHEIPRAIKSDPSIRTAYAVADAALRVRDAIDDCFSAEWTAAHAKASGLYLEARALFDQKFYAY